MNELGSNFCSWVNEDDRRKMNQALPDGFSKTVDFIRSTDSLKYFRKYTSVRKYTEWVEIVAKGAQRNTRSRGNVAVRNSASRNHVRG